jgi:NitT/TauT family transport system substrate-binding protein
MVNRREFIRFGVGIVGAVTVGDALAACASAATPASASPTPLPPPETATIRLTLLPCDLPIMAAERNLRDEGFTDVQFSDTAAIAALTGGKADLGTMFEGSLATAVEAGKPLVGLGGLHPGCVQIWGAQGVATLKDLSGRTVVVRSKAPDDLTYSWLAISLKNAGVDPGSVNFVVQPAADLTKMFLDGKSDLLFLATTGAFAFQTNSANKGHVVLDQAMEAPWSQQNCCVLTTTTDWVKANPVAAKRALRAIYRAADAIPTDRADVAKVATDKGLFGGAQNVALVRGASNMVPYDWRKYDAAASMRFHAKLLNEVGLLKMTPDESVTKTTDTRFWRQLQTELKR